MGPRHHLSFCACKTKCLASELIVSTAPRPLLWFLHAISDFRTRKTSLYGSQTSPVFFCSQNSSSWIRITSLYGSQPSSVVFACKTATFGSELQVSMCPRLHLRFFVFKTAPLAPELQVSMGPSPHLWFLHAKQRLLDQNYKSIWVPDIT